MYNNVNGYVKIHNYLMIPDYVIREQNLELTSVAIVVAAKAPINNYLTTFPFSDVSIIGVWCFTSA